jgi:hypothetical protein
MTTTTRFSALITLLLIVSLTFPENTFAATLALSPSSGTYLVNQTFDVSVVLDTSGAETGGTDVIVLFDNTKLNLIDILPGSLYVQYIGENISNSTGRATISGIASSTSNLYSGAGTFATLRFRTLETGTANVSFEYTLNNLNDTNVAVINKSGDSLTSVQNATYTISTSTSSNTPTATPGSGSSTTSTTSTTTTATTTYTQPTGNDNMPVSGSSIPALLIAIVGGFFLWLSTLLGKEA